jgi:hypothetical protein
MERIKYTIFEHTMLENWLSIIESMSTEYTKFILIVFLLLILSGGLWFLQSSATKAIESFVVDDYTISQQKNFIDAGIESAKIGNAAIDKI